MSQEQMILKHLKQHKTITPMEALNLYGCFRLAARIDDLRKNNTIETEYITNGRKKYAQYRYIADKNNALL